jgi:hypothetical protein
MGDRQRLLDDACLPTRTWAPALRVTVYELAKAGGLNQQTNISGWFILNINTSPKEHLVFTIYLRYSPLTRRQATFSFVLSRSGHVLDLTTTRARAPALYVMGDRQWLLGNACALTHKRVLSTLRYGVWASRGWWYDTEPTGRKLLIFKIWTLQTNIMFIYNCLARYIMYYLFYIFVLQGSSFGQWAIFLHSRTDSPGKDNRIIVRMVAPPGVWTSPPINWSNR